MLHNLLCHILLTAVWPRSEELELVKLLTQATHVLHYTQDWDAHLHPSGRGERSGLLLTVLCWMQCSSAVETGCSKLQGADREVQWQPQAVATV